jgi:hypothetical protein
MQFTEVAAGRIKQPGGPRAGTPNLHTSHFAINNYIYIDSPLEKRIPIIPIAANWYVDYKRTYSLKRMCCDATSAVCYPYHMLHNRLISFGTNLIEMTNKMQLCREIFSPLFLDCSTCFERHYRSSSGASKL